MTISTRRKNAVMWMAAGVLLLGIFSRAAHASVTFTNMAVVSGSPRGNLVQGRDGKLYGITLGGVVFRMSLDGTYTNFATLAVTNGVSANGLAEGIDGNFYGTSWEGGATVNSPGTLFKVTPEGVVTTIVAFNGTNGSYPHSPPILASNGFLYGTTSQGGTSPSSMFAGTIYRLGPNGLFTTLVNFSGTNQTGFYPMGALGEGRDGFLYGLTSSGGSITNADYAWYGFGTTFRMSLDGELTFISSFDGTNGDSPLFPPVQAADGNFYGTTFRGGVYKGGSVYGFGNFFRISADGMVTNVFSFAGTNGSYPLQVLQCADGNFYGLCRIGGPSAGPTNTSGLGNIFKLTPDGQFTVLMNFDVNTVGFSYAGLMQASDGNLYGTTDHTVFRLSIPLPPAFKSVTQTNAGIALTWSSVASQTYQVQYRMSPTFGNWSNLGGAITATNGIMTTFDNPGPDAQRLYRVALIP